MNCPSSPRSVLRLFSHLRRGEISPVLLWVFVFFILGGVVIAWNYFVSTTGPNEPDRPPYAYNLERQDIELLRRDGSAISLFEIGQQEKPWVFATFFTSCPGQCQGVVEQLVWLDQQLGEGEINFALMSFDPLTDRPVRMKAWTSQWPELKGEHWHFLTAPEGVTEEIIHDYLVQPLKLSKPKWKVDVNGERDYSQEPSHPMNALVFTQNDVRGSYTLGVVPGVTTPAMVRQKRAVMLETLEKLLRDKEWLEKK